MGHGERAFCRKKKAGLCIFLVVTYAEMRRRSPPPPTRALRPLTPPERLLRTSRDGTTSDGDTLTARAHSPGPSQKSLCGGARGSAYVSSELDRSNSSLEAWHTSSFGERARHTMRTTPAHGLTFLEGTERPSSMELGTRARACAPLVVGRLGARAPVLLCGSRRH